MGKNVLVMLGLQRLAVNGGGILCYIGCIGAVLIGCILCIHGANRIFLLSLL